MQDGHDPLPAGDLLWLLAAGLVGFVAFLFFMSR